ncbi:MAG: hypothetical protein Q4G34_01020 [Micrococcus sp.]|nr:hypothetical protein [Micrococcus sp.]
MKRQLSTRVAGDVLQEARAAVAAMQRIDGPAYTLSRLVEDALVAETARLRAEHHHGEPFPATQSPLPPGTRLRREDLADE